MAAKYNLNDPVKVKPIQEKDFLRMVDGSANLVDIVHWIFDEIDLVEIIKMHYSADTIYNEDELEDALKAVKDNK